MDIFSHIKNITTHKGEYLGDEGFNNWMINRFLSMDPDYCELVNLIQKNTWMMEGKHLYKIYKDLIPKQYKFLKYIKSSNKKSYEESELEAVQFYFQVSSKRAKEYIEMLPKEELELIKSQINGKQ